MVRATDADNINNDDMMMMMMIDNGGSDEDYDDDYNDQDDDNDGSHAWSDRDRNCELRRANAFVTIIVVDDNDRCHRKQGGYM